MNLADKLLAANYVELKTGNEFLIDLRYATPNNFVGRNLYGDFNRAFLHPIAAKKIFYAVQTLQSLKRGYRFIIFDALRPRSAQYELWNVVVNTSNQGYIANPERGSVHNFGLAVDLSIVDESSREIDMGTPFDAFTELAQPQLEERFLKDQSLSVAQHSNRLLLRNIMVQSGFAQLPHEWWHYDALPGNEVRAQFTIVE